MKIILLGAMLIFGQGCMQAVAVWTALSVLHELSQDEKIEKLEENKESSLEGQTADVNEFDSRALPQP